MTYNHILVPLDGSELDQSILPHIKTMVRSGLAKRITFVHVIEATIIPPIYAHASGRYINTNTTLLGNIIAEKVSKAENYLMKLISSLSNSETDLKWQVLPPGSGIASSIAKYAVKNGVDFIMMASRAGRNSALDLGKRY